LPGKSGLEKLISGQQYSSEGGIFQWFKQKKHFKDSVKPKTGLNGEKRREKRAQARSKL